MLKWILEFLHKYNLPKYFVGPIYSEFVPFKEMEEPPEWVLGLTSDDEVTYIPCSGGVISTFRFITKSGDRLLLEQKSVSGLCVNNLLIYDQEHDVHTKNIDKVYLELNNIEGINLTKIGLKELDIPPYARYVICWGNDIKRLTLPESIEFLNCDRDVEITNLEEIREKNPNVHVIMG